MVPGWGAGVRVRELVGPATGATARALYYLEIAPGQQLERVHRSEAAYYVHAGHGWIAEPGGPRRSLREGLMVLVDAGTRYRIVAEDAGLVLIGGPCPPEPPTRPPA